MNTLSSLGGLTVSVLLGGCVRAHHSSEDAFGCRVPEAHTFTISNLTIEAANAEIDSLRSNIGRVETRARVESLASQAAINEQLMAYARCRALSEKNPSRMTHEQWLDFEDRVRYANSVPPPTPADWDRFYASRKPQLSEAERVQRAYESFLRDHAAWQKERDLIAEQNKHAEQNYSLELSKRVLYNGTIRRGERGPNFRMDIENGSTLVFEIAPGGTLRMRRDRPNGEDPLIFHGVGNGDTRRTTWNPNCEHCDWYFKQDDVDEMTITVWNGGKPSRPVLKQPRPEPKLPDLAANN